MSVGDIIWFFFMFTALQPVLRQRMLEAMRTRKIARLEKERNSRVMLLVHRQETMRFLGFPLARYIDINDSEEVLRANQVTDGEVPLDMWSLHSRRAGSGGAPDRASRLRPQIQGHRLRAALRHVGKHACCARGRRNRHVQALRPRRYRSATRRFAGRVPAQGRPNRSPWRKSTIRP